MRSEYRQKTGLIWRASDFKGWNEYTNVLKKIRNATLHGNPIELDEAVLCIYKNVEFAIDTDNDFKKIRNNYRAITIRSYTGNALSKSVILNRFGFAKKSIMNSKQSYFKDYELPIKEFFYYELRWQVLGINVLLDAHQNIVDVVKLTLKSFSIYKLYMSFYKLELTKNLSDCYKAD